MKKETKEKAHKIIDNHKSLMVIGSNENDVNIECLTFIRSKDVSPFMAAFVLQLKENGMSFGEILIRFEEAFKFVRENDIKINDLS